MAKIGLLGLGIKNQGRRRTPFSVIGANLTG